MKSLSVTILIKATEQYFPVVLFIILYKVVLTFELGIKSLTEAIQMTATHRSSSFLWNLLSCCSHQFYRCTL